MPKLTHKLPSYRLHKVSGNAVVTLNGRDHYLGAHGSPESVDAYKRLIGEWTTAGPAAAIATNTASTASTDYRSIRDYCLHRASRWELSSSEWKLLRRVCRPTQSPKSA